MKRRDFLKAVGATLVLPALPVPKPTTEQLPSQVHDKFVRYYGLTFHAVNARLVRWHRGGGIRAPKEDGWAEPNCSVFDFVYMPEYETFDHWERNRDELYWIGRYCVEIQFHVNPDAHEVWDRVTFTQSIA